MATTHTTQSHTYWRVRLMRGDEVVNGIDWLVALPDEADTRGRGHLIAISAVITGGMLPTDYTEEIYGGSGYVLQPGYSLDAEVVEWEINDGIVAIARLF